VDSRSFDAFTRKLTTRLQRRGTLAVLAAAAAPLLFGGADHAHAGCKKVGKKCDKNQDCCDHATCKGDTKNKKGKCRCKGGFTECGGKCYDLDKDEKHCGACNNACAPGSICQDGSCACVACEGAEICENGQCQCPAANQCGDVCCDEPASCFEDYCQCPSTDFGFCSCPAGDGVCDGGGCCLEQDECITPVDCFDGERCSCRTQTCGAGNAACHNEFAFCGSGPQGSCGCFTLGDGSPLCAILPEGHYCPESSECVTDDECGDGEVCADVGCCNLSVEPFVGRCVTPCS
jgi:hypothetical protein